MKRLLFGGLVALALAVPAAPVKADCAFEYSCSRHLSYVHTSKSRCFSFSSYANPLPCMSGCCSTAPAMWNGLAAYGAPAYAPAAYAAPVAAVPATAAPVAPAPAFKAPQPAPATNTTTGVQQAGYFYYGPSSTASYGYNAGFNYGAGYNYGYGYGYGYGASYAQVPNYWY